MNKFKFKNIFWLTCTLLLAQAFTSEVQAEGTNRQALVTTALRVCADPNNMPYSSKEQQGFENKIVDLIAAELGVPVRYTWWPQTIGFIRNTLRAFKCDLVAGMTTTSELVQNTNPYYWSIYTMVYREDSGITATELTDPQLRDKRFGVVAGGPPATILALNNMASQMKGYPLFVDTRLFSVGQMMVDDLVSGETDVALMWGPSAGYFAEQADVNLKVVPLMNEDPAIRLSFRMSMAVRYNETEWKRKINRILRKLQPQIDEIMHEYHVPLLNSKGELIVQN